MTPATVFAFAAIGLAPLGIRTILRAAVDPDAQSVAEHARRMELLAPKDPR